MRWRAAAEVTLRRSSSTAARQRSLPAELDGLDNAVLTRTSIHTGQLDKRRFTACGQPPVPSHTAIVERTGIHGSSWTFADDPALYGCDAILDPSTAAEPDRPYDGIWCGSANGRIEDDMLNDPRLDLCTNTDSEITAFAWVDPRPDAKWVVVSDTGKREVYEVVESLPVRVTTTENVNPAGKASFHVEEYGADGALLTEYTLEAAVAG